MLSKYKILIAYDGTSFGGFQAQENTISIQQLIEQALTKILRQPIRIVGAGRTDAGVHALGQVAHFSAELNYAIPRLLRSANSLLPQEIRLLAAEPVDDHFHARYLATGKTYFYRLHLDQTASPFKRFYSHHVRHQFDLELLRKGASLFVGTHDFTSFANEASRGSAAHNPVRTISALDIVEEEGGIRLEFTGNGFLYKMVRNITGTLLDVAKGKLAIEKIPTIFAARDRRLAAAAAPPHGLCLAKVHY